VQREKKGSWGNEIRDGGEGRQQKKQVEGDEPEKGPLRGRRNNTEGCLVVVKRDQNTPEDETHVIRG